MNLATLLRPLLAITLALGTAGCGFSSDKKEDAGQDAPTDRQGTPQDVSREVGLVCNDAACVSCPASAPQPGDLCSNVGLYCDYWDPNPAARNPGCHCLQTDANTPVWNCVYQL